MTSLHRHLVIGVGCLFLLLGVRAAEAVEYEAIKDPFWDRFILHVNGLSYHVGGSSNELNERNWGAGAGYDIGRLESGGWFLNEAVISLNADLYSDSFAEFGYAFGVSIQQKLVGPIDLGAQAGFVHENNIVDKGGWYLFPFLVPFLETTFEFPVNCRLTFVPPLEGYSDGLLTLQALVRF
jgi:hypothetical protein